MQHEAGKSANGFLSQDVAQTAHSVWSAIVQSSQTWDQADQFAWGKLADRAIRLIDEAVAAESEMSAGELAKTLFGWYTGEERQEIGDVFTRLTWETIGRHLVNCLDSEPGSVKMSEQEVKATAWFRRKISTQGVSV